MNVEAPNGGGPPKLNPGPPDLTIAGMLLFRSMAAQLWAMGSLVERPTMTKSSEAFRPKPSLESNERPIRLG